jgi:hypothetical protein
LVHYVQWNLGAISRRRGQWPRRASQRGIGHVDFAVSAGLFMLLAVVAVPRQARFTEEVRRQQVVSLGFSVQSAVRLAHAQWQSRGKPPVLKVPRGEVEMVRGYPAPRDLKVLLEEPEVMAFHEDHGIWQHTDLRRSEPCGVSYAPPGADNAIPTIREHLSGC